MNDAGLCVAQLEVNYSADHASREFVGHAGRHVLSPLVGGVQHR